MIIIMMKIDNRTPLSRVELLQTQLGNTSPLKRNIKISNPKFPADFFKDAQFRDNNCVFSSISKVYGETSGLYSRNLPQTHQEVRNNIFSTCQNSRVCEKKSLTSDLKRREMSTALESRVERMHSSGQYEQDLIKSVLTTARQMKKMIRKHSIQLRKDREGNKDDVELPPLKLKRGFTTAF